MNVIEINVSNADGTIIGKLDIGKAEINTIFQLADIKDPSSKNTDHTLQMTIPGTKNNNSIFQHIYENGFASYAYNPNKKLIAQIIVNGNQYLNGSLQVNEVNKIDNKSITYTVTIYGQFGTFMEDIANLKLKDLISLSEYNHIFNEHNMIGSWDSFIVKNGSESQFNLGDGYVYPLEYRGQTGNVWYPDAMKPAIYIKTIFDKILKSKGITYRSNFLIGDIFKKLILPYSGDENMPITQSAIDRTETAVYQGSAGGSNQPYVGMMTVGSNTGTSWPDTGVWFNNRTSAPAKDPNGNYLASSAQLYIPKNGNFTINVSVPTSLMISKYTVSGVGPYDYIKFMGTIPKVTVYLHNDTTNTTLNSTTADMVDSRWGDDTFHNVDSTTGSWRTERVPISVTYTGAFNAHDCITVKVKFEIPANSNHTYLFRRSGIDFYDHHINLQMYVQMDVLSSGIWSVDEAPGLSLTNNSQYVVNGDMLDLNYFLPDVKVTDFISEINKLFNLYWVPTGDKQFIIEPRDEFYQHGTIHDWTYQVNNALVLKEQPLYDIQSKKYTFTYSEDNDYYNKDYLSSKSELYGTKSLTLDNDFVTEATEIKSGFSPTPTVQHLGTKRNLPSYVSSEDGAGFKYYKNKWRILFYGGLKPLGTNVHDWWFLSNHYTNKILTQKVYPYSGHLDDPLSPNNDLNWAVCKKYYFTWSNMTNNGLYNKYYRNQIDESTDKNGHLLTATIILTDLDIINLDFRDTIQVNNVYYRINKITHNPLTDVAEVELIKIKNYKPFIPSTISSGNGSDTTSWGNRGDVYRLETQLWSNEGYTLGRVNLKPYVNNATTPSWTNYRYSEIASFSQLVKSPSNVTDNDYIPKIGYSALVNKSNNFYSLQASHEVVGFNNFVDPSANNIKVIGDNNRVSTSAVGISISGNNNYVSSGVKNVSIIGDNHIVTESDVSYNHGSIITSNGIRAKVQVIRGGVNSASIQSKLLKANINSVKAGNIFRGGVNKS